MPGKEELPGTLQRSPDKAQRTWVKAHDSAADTYGEGEAAHRAAMSAVKHSFEKVGDHWEPKDHQGPSDERASHPRSRQDQGRSAGGVDVAGHTKEELYERAQDLDVEGRSSMNKQELAEAIASRQD